MFAGPQWIWKLPGSFEIHWIRQYMVNFMALMCITNGNVYMTEPNFTGLELGKHCAGQCYNEWSIIYGKPVSIGIGYNQISVCWYDETYTREAVGMRNLAVSPNLNVSGNYQGHHFDDIIVKDIHVIWVQLYNKFSHFLCHEFWKIVNKDCDWRFVSEFTDM